MLRRIRNNLTDVIASRHVAGNELADALLVCRWAESQGFRSSISPWRGPDDNPRKMFEYYAAAISAIRQEEGLCYLSIKLDSIGYDTGMFNELLNHAGVNGVRIHVDSLGPETADTALSFVERGASSGHCVGYTLASRWRRSKKDAERIGELGIPVRIVKGQWPDPDSRGVDCRQNYLDIAENLAGSRCQVAVATHDTALAREALPRLLYEDTYAEMEQFFSLPLNGVSLSRRLQCPYRLYIAYGHPGIPYNIRYTLNRPSIAAWVFADLALRPRKPWSHN